MNHTLFNLVAAAATAELLHAMMETFSARGKVKRLDAYIRNVPYKNDLVRAVIQYQEQGVVGAQERALAHLDTLDGLRAWADAVVDVQRQMHCRGGCPIGSLGSELAETDPEARFEVAASFERWAGAIRDGLRSMQAHGRLSAAASPDDLAVAVLAALQGGFLVGQVQRSIRPLQIALDAMLALIATYAASPTSLRGLQAQDFTGSPGRRSET